MELSEEVDEEMKTSLTNTNWLCDIGQVFGSHVSSLTCCQTITVLLWLGLLMDLPGTEQMTGHYRTITTIAGLTDGS